MIEPEIVTWACRKATKEQIAKLRELCNEVERLYKQGYNHIQKDIEFHSYLAKLSEHKDPVGAKCAMNMHLTYNRQVIMEFLEKKKKVRKNHEPDDI